MTKDQLLEQVLEHIHQKAGNKYDAWYLDLDDPNATSEASLSTEVIQDMITSAELYWPGIFEDQRTVFLTETSALVLIDFILSKTMRQLAMIWMIDSVQEEYPEHWDFIKYYEHVRKCLQNALYKEETGGPQYCRMSGKLLCMTPEDDNEILEELTSMKTPNEFGQDDYDWLSMIDPNFWENDEDGRQLLLDIFKKKIDDGSLFLKPQPVSKDVYIEPDNDYRLESDIEYTDKFD